LKKTVVRKSRAHAISGTFVFLLLGVFAALSVMMVSLSTQLYHSIVSASDVHNADRVLNNYIRNTVKANESAESIRIDDLKGTKMLVFEWKADGEVYETRIYCYNNILMESLDESDREFRPELGERIADVQAFEPEIDGEMLTVRLKDANGGEKTLHMALCCAQEGMR